MKYTFLAIASKKYIYPVSNTAWSSIGNLPTGANLPAGAYTVRATATDKMGNETTVFSSFTVQAQPIPTYSVSGRITLGTAGLANVKVTRTGNVSVVTGANGDFTFAGIAANTNITVTPALAGYTFNPASRAVAVKTANITAQNFAATSTLPTITGFTPVSGPVGTQVTINGTNLANATAVKFGNVAAVIKTKTATQIITTVPTGAVTARISVTVGTSTATSGTNFTVTVPTSTAPTVASFTPVSGPVGTQVTINGTNFATATAVKFNNVAAVIKTKTATQIVTTVPAGATTGRISVTNPTSTATSTTNFTVTVPTSTAPTIANFTPASGPVGTTVTINGTNLSTVTSVKFNVSAAVIKSKTATQLVAVVPTGATTGRISVTNPTATATSTTNFTVTTANTQDTTAPVVTFTTPAANGRYTSLAAATGTASDAGTGVKGVYLQLYKVSADGQTIVAVYDWANGTWGVDDSLDTTIAVATGTTSWKLTMPALPAGIYEIYATALDNTTPTPNQTQWSGRRFTITGAGIKNSAGSS